LGWLLGMVYEGFARRFLLLARTTSCIERRSRPFPFLFSTKAFGNSRSFRHVKLEKDMPTLSNKLSGSDRAILSTEEHPVVHR
jgi:hypothetical protein